MMKNSRFHLITALIVILVIFLVSAKKPVGKGVSSVGPRRGSGEKAVVSRSKKNTRIPDEDKEDDDNEEEDSQSYSEKSSSRKRRRVPPSRTSTKGSRSKPSKRNAMPMVPWGAAKQALPNIREKLEDFAKQGQSVYSNIYRRAKVMRSSAFEGMLLKATWPDNDPVPAEILTEIIKHSIPAFKHGRHSSDDDPYHMTLHKLWTKLCEKDYRTVVKSLFILHCISRDSSTDACDKFAMAIKDMARVRNPKNPEHRYFELGLVNELDEKSEPYEYFVAAYAAYVLNRAKTFSGKFEDLKEITSETSEKLAVARLKKAKQAISLGLKCIISDKELHNFITGASIQQVSNDLKDLWRLFSEKLAPFVTGGAGYPGTKASPNDVLSLLAFYKETENEIKSYFSKVSKVYDPMRIKIPKVDADSIAKNTGITAANVAEKISSFSNLSGGYTPSNTDEEDENDEEEDEAKESEVEEVDGDSEEVEEEDDEDDDDSKAEKETAAADDDEDGIEEDEDAQDNEQDTEDSEETPTGSKGEDSDEEEEEEGEEDDEEDDDEDGDDDENNGEAKDSSVDDADDESVDASNAADDDDDDEDKDDDECTDPVDVEEDDESDEEEDEDEDEE